MKDKQPASTKNAASGGYQDVASKGLVISGPSGGPFEWDANKELKPENGPPLPEFAKGAPHESEKTGGVL